MAFIVLAPRSCPTTRRVAYVERAPVRTPGRDGCRNCGWSGHEVENSAARRPFLSVPCGTMGDKKSGPPPGGGGPQHVECRRRPTLPHPNECSTIGAGGLSFRVRNGTGRSPSAITTDNTIKLPTHQPAGNPKVVCSGSHSGCEQHVVNKPSAY